jgi:hypothetical protein
VNGSLLSPFEHRLKEKVDILLFNPPYVPTSGEEALGAQTIGDIGGAWAGGSDGMQVTNVLLERVEVRLCLRVSLLQCTTVSCVNLYYHHRQYCLQMVASISLH